MNAGFIKPLCSSTSVENLMKIYPVVPEISLLVGRPLKNIIQEGLAVASIVQDDPSTLPGDDPFPRARMHRDRNCVVNWYRNLKPKLAIMRQCTSITDRRSDRRTLTS